MTKPWISMKKVKASEIAVFEGVYEKYSASLYRYIFCQVKSKEDAEDLTQTVFIKIYEKKDLGRGDGLKVGYFFTVAKNAIIDHWRKKKEIAVDFSDKTFPELIDAKVDIQGKIHSDESAEALRKMLEKLSDDQREVITLKYISDLSNREISEITGKNEEAIRQLQSRALRKLRGLIKFGLTHLPGKNS